MGLIFFCGGSLIMNQIQLSAVALPMVRSLEIKMAVSVVFVSTVHQYNN